MAVYLPYQSNKTSTSNQCRNKILHFKRLAACAQDSTVIMINNYTNHGHSDHPELDPVLTMDEMGVRMFYERMLRVKEKTIEDLQVSVHQNYSEFVLISKEVANILYNQLQ